MTASDSVLKVLARDLGIETDGYSDLAIGAAVEQMFKAQGEISNRRKERVTTLEHNVNGILGPILQLADLYGFERSTRPLSTLLNHISRMAIEDRNLLGTLQENLVKTETENAKAMHSAILLADVIGYTVGDDSDSLSYRLEAIVNGVKADEEELAKLQQRTAELVLVADFVFDLARKIAGEGNVPDTEEAQGQLIEDTIDIALEVFGTINHAYTTVLGITDAQEQKLPFKARLLRDWIAGTVKDLKPFLELAQEIEQREGRIPGKPMERVLNYLRLIESNYRECEETAEMSARAIQRYAAIIRLSPEQYLVQIPMIETWIQRMAQLEMEPGRVNAEINRMMSALELDDAGSAIDNLDSIRTYALVLRGKVNQNADVVDKALPEAQAFERKLDAVYKMVGGREGRTRKAQLDLIHDWISTRI